ncbi:MAG: MFS transporter [Bacteroidetes bacterium]|nr:MFS transporter [Bacteroidota bacterium]
MQNRTPKPGLKENWKAFALLVGINALVGGMVGIERSIFPEYAETIFGIASKSAILSFIVAFGLSKAVANYFTGRWANRVGRKNLLLAGWLIFLPVPMLLMWAPDWSWVVIANVLLGFGQGLAWSSTVVMKIDLVGVKNRGLAMGLNEFAGYLAVGITAYITGWIAGQFGVVPYPFYLGLAIAVSGFVLTLIWVKDTRGFVELESVEHTGEKTDHIFLETTWKNKTLSSVTQAGLVNNLNDGMIWGLLPMYLLSLKLTMQEIGMIAAVYPMVWGLGQLITGKMADHFSRKSMLVWGMLLQGFAIVLIPFSHQLTTLAALSALLGIGTALVYPTFLTEIAHSTHPAQRAGSMGVFRLWRDLGYAIGAILSGMVADQFGITYAIVLVAAITALSALIVQIRMPSGQNTCECIKAETVLHALRLHKPVKLLDVRSAAEYNEAHIPNAIHVALDELDVRLNELNRKETIITVCGKGGGRSAAGAKRLRELGYKAKWLCGGTFAWLGIHPESGSTASGMPV